MVSNLMSYLPENYEGSRETVTIQKAIQPELDMIWKKRDDLLLQLNPNTATWGLAYWEEAFGLPADETRPLAQRRSRVIARIRGLGTTTVERLQTVVETFCPGCQVTIVELYSKYVVEIHLKVTDVAPSDLDGLRAELDLIMPEHLSWYFAVTIETVGRLPCGGYSEMASHLEIWPQLVNELESTGTAALANVLSYRATMEIYPNEGGK